MAHGMILMTAVRFRKPRLSKGSIWQKLCQALRSLFCGE